MHYPERFSALLGYPFPRLRKLLQGIPAGNEPLRLSIGEPEHRFPAKIMDILQDQGLLFNRYPKNNGEEALLDAITGYGKRRLGLKNLSADMMTPLNGTREGLYMSALSLLPEKKNGQAPLVLLPNPFYQVYMMGARTLGLEVRYMNTEAKTSFLPDLDSISAKEWSRAVAFFLCSPSNPHGAIAGFDYLKRLLTLAEDHDFFVFADECYAELYYDRAPVSAHYVAAEIGCDPNRVLIFHSLSKRSNLPGLRSGFVISGKETTAKIQELRSYAGAPIPAPIQMASAWAWSDDEHVFVNRALYADKMKDVTDILGSQLRPEGGFFLWLPVDDGEEVTKALWREHGIEVLPGSYLSAETSAGNPGQGYIRVAMVAPQNQTKPALEIIKEFILKK